MIKLIGSLVVLLAAIIVGLSVYLQPNDMRGCEIINIEDRCPNADAIVVVSGGDTLARADHAIRLFHDGWADKLIFSGAAQDTSGPSNAAVMRQHAISSGVPTQDIYIEDKSVNTQQNATNSSRIFEDNSIDSIILVTSGYHQRRASLEFNQNTDVAVFNNPLYSDKDWSRFWWLTPRGWYLAVSEFFKSLAVHARDN